MVIYWVWSSSLKAFLARKPRRCFPSYHHQGDCLHLVGMFLSCTPRAFSLSALRRRPRGSRYCNARPRFSPLVLKERLEGTKVKRFPWWRRIRGNVLRPGEKKYIFLNSETAYAYKWKVMAGGYARKRGERKKTCSGLFPWSRIYCQTRKMQKYNSSGLMQLEYSTALDHSQSRRERTLCNALNAVVRDLSLPSKAKIRFTGYHTSSEAW